jgi:hypothetical protein
MQTVLSGHVARQIYLEYIRRVVCRYYLTEEKKIIYLMLKLNIDVKIE